MDVILLNIDCVPKPEDMLAIDAHNFPDANFCSYIAARHDANHDGFLSPEEIMSVMYMDVATAIDWVVVITRGRDIEDLTGIQYFPALTYLQCGNNLLINLDLSANPVLTKLDCAYNQLTSLDVSANTALTELFCLDNQLTNLDLSGCPNLCYLDCGRNALTNLDLSVNIALTKLECSENQLTSLDVSANTALEYLDCYDNNLQSLDLSGCPNLSYLRCPDNQLTSLDVTANTALTFLNCGYNALTNLDLSANTMLISEYDYYHHSSFSNQFVDATMTEADGTYRLDFADLVGAENAERVTVIAVEPKDVPYSVQDGVLTAEAALTSLKYEYDHGGPDIGTMNVTLALH